jgi:hypothetical protein
MPFISAFTGRSAFWDQTHPLFEQQTELWEKLIPANGEASTEHGELLRIFSNLINDIFGDGLSNDRSKGLIYIYERRSKYQPFLKMDSIFLLSQIIEAQNHYKKYETEALIVNQSFCDRLDDIMQAIIQYCTQQVEADFIKVEWVKGLSDKTCVVVGSVEGKEKIHIFGELIQWSVGIAEEVTETKKLLKCYSRAIALYEQGVSDDNYTD